MRQFAGLVFLLLVSAVVNPACKNMVAQKPLRRELTQSARNLLGMDFVLIRAGTFTMGLSESEARETTTTFRTLTATPDLTLVASQKPAHLVRIRRPFYIGKYEVITQTGGGSVFCIKRGAVMVV